MVKDIHAAWRAEIDRQKSKLNPYIFVATSKTRSKLLQRRIEAANAARIAGEYEAILKDKPDKYKLKAVLSLKLALEKIVAYCKEHGNYKNRTGKLRASIRSIVRTYGSTVQGEVAAGGINGVFYAYYVERRPNYWVLSGALASTSLMSKVRKIIRQSISLNDILTNGVDNIFTEKIVVHTKSSSVEVKRKARAYEFGEYTGEYTGEEE